MKRCVCKLCGVCVVLLSVSAMASDKVTTEVVDGVEYSYVLNAHGASIVGLKKSKDLSSTKLKIRASWAARKLG